jgi:phenylacetate-coenzyme A ligase PaaK-like adenylate-forming protein
LPSHSILTNTANFYRVRAREDDRYVAPRDALDSVLCTLGFNAEADTAPIRNSSQFIVLRTSGTTGEPKLLRHSMDFHESVVESGIEALSRRGLSTTPHTCLIAISRGRLSGGFLFIYEVARRCGWSILLLGASDDPDDIADLCAAHSVDVVFMAPNNIGATFTRNMTGRFDSVRDLLYIGEMPSPSLADRLHRDFPHIRLRPFIYSSNDTGPMGIPASEDSDTTYEVPQNVLLEVESDDAGVTLNGTGQILVSVLGLEDPKLIRWRIGDEGVLTTDSEGRQTIELLGRGEVSVKFHLDSIGGSVILYKSVLVEFLKGCGIHADKDLIVRIRNDRHSRTVVDINLISEDPRDLTALEERFNNDFPVKQLRGRFKVLSITDEEAKRISPGKRRFFIKSYDDKGMTNAL